MEKLNDNFINSTIQAYIETMRQQLQTGFYERDGSDRPQCFVEDYPLFQLARKLQAGIPKDVDYETKIALCERFVGAGGYRLFLDMNDARKDGSNDPDTDEIDEGDLESIFIQAWDAVKVPPGAFERAKASTEKIFICVKDELPEAKRLRTDAEKRLCLFCWCLQNEVGNVPFMLSVRRASEIATGKPADEADPKEGHRKIKKLIQAGILKPAGLVGRTKTYFYIKDES